VDNGDAKQRVALRKLTPFDIVIIVFIMLLAVGIILRASLTQRWQASKAIEAAVYHDGKIHQHLALDNDREISLLDGQMLIEIKGKKLRVKESGCPRQVCVNIGWIQHSGEAIICVPFKTLIEIKSADSPVLDAVVF
jgi:hypothetical protein